MSVNIEIPYLLRKNGMWYAHNDCGYTGRAELAELYTKEYAENTTKHHDDITAVPVTDIINSVEHVQEYIDRLEAIKLAIKHSEEG
jgi:hypothetical protein